MDKAQHVRALFDAIVARYDLMNRLMTAGRDLAWRRRAAAELALPPGGRILDLGAGTADFALALARQHPSARTIALDFSRPMLERGRQKAAGAPAGTRLAFALGDALRLPFPDATFDAVVSAFLLRNLVDLDQAFAEMARVVRPAGRVLCLELTRPTLPLFRQAFAFYFGRLVPLLGRLLSPQPAAYRYLPKSLEMFITAQELQRVMERAGWRGVAYRRFMAGVVAIHSGYKSAASTPPSERIHKAF